MSGALVEVLLDTLRLGAEPPAGLSSRWLKADPDRLIDLVAYEGAEIWLFRRLRVLGILDTLPASFQDHLKRQAFDTAARGLVVEAEAISVLGCLQRQNIPVVLIKGLARRALSARFPYLDARATNDVDLLLPADRIEEGYQLLLAEGYVPALTTGPGPDHHHLPVLWNERRIGVELHSSTAARIRADVAWARAQDAGLEVEWCGLNVRVPAPTEMAFAAVAHALTDRIVHGFRLQHFLEVSALLAGGMRTDWSPLIGRRDAGEVRDAATAEEYPELVLHKWLDGASQLVRSADHDGPQGASHLDLHALLSWRLTVLESKHRVGRAMTDRMLEEGPRVLLGLAPEAMPPASTGLATLRRRAAGRLSRALFRTWRGSRGG